VLAQNLTDRAFGDSGPTLRSLDEYETRTESRDPGPDPDGDTAELFYPEFYAVGPDAGRHVDAPNRWGQTNTLSPDDDVLTADLYGVVDDAIARLADPLGQLVQLVDIDDVSVANAAKTLRLDENDAADALHRARVHLRGVVDSVLAVRS
jgi:DNA-directed RNA polymerase specialized sigma24 family protein